VRPVFALHGHSDRPSGLRRPRQSPGQARLFAGSVSQKWQTIFPRPSCTLRRALVRPLATGTYPMTVAADARSEPVRRPHLWFEPRPNLFGAKAVREPPLRRARLIVRLDHVLIAASAY